MTDAAGFRPGVRLALDWGHARIGVAACDAHGTLAYPVETIAPASDPGVVERRLRALVAEYEPIEFILGLPRHLKGVEGAAAAGVREKAGWLVRRFPEVPVRLVDERLTTVAAERQLRAAGRPARRQRAVIDQAAAVGILEQALDRERATGRPGGEVVDAERTQG
nr:Holliday junction resolvase RuvX [Propionibacterium sp.]